MSEKFETSSSFDFVARRCIMENMLETLSRERALPVERAVMLFPNSNLAEQAVLYLRLNKWIPQRETIGHEG